MAGFEDSHPGKLGELVGSRLLLVPGARIVIEDLSSVILLQYRSDFGLWGLPGGNAEPGEDLTDVVKREVLEETGLTIADPRPYGFGCTPDLETVRFPNGDECQFFVRNFWADSYAGHPIVANDESLSLGWFDPDDLPQMMPNMMPSIPAYRRFRETGEFQLF